MVFSFFEIIFLMVKWTLAVGVPLSHYHVKEIVGRHTLKKEYLLGYRRRLE